MCGSPSCSVGANLAQLIPWLGINTVAVFADGQGVSAVFHHVNHAAAGFVQVRAVVETAFFGMRAMLGFLKAHVDLSHAEVMPEGD